MNADLARADTEGVREVHRRFITGVTVVTTMDGPVPRGLAVNAFCSVSLDPPTVLVSVQQSSSTYPALISAAHLAINIRSTDQLHVANVFASKTTDKFAALAWNPGPHGSPMLEGTSASMEIAIEQRLRASTHTVFVGRVVDARHADRDPLVYQSGQFFDSASLRRLDGTPGRQA